MISVNRKRRQPQHCFLCFDGIWSQYLPQKQNQNQNNENTFRKETKNQKDPKSKIQNKWKWERKKKTVTGSWSGGLVSSPAGLNGGFRFWVFSIFIWPWFLIGLLLLFDFMGTSVAFIAIDCISENFLLFLDWLHLTSMMALWL